MSPACTRLPGLSPRGPSPAAPRGFDTRAHTAGSMFGQCKGMHGSVNGLDFAGRKLQGALDACAAIHNPIDHELSLNAHGRGAGCIKLFHGWRAYSLLISRALQVIQS